MWIQMATGSMALLASFTANGMGNDVLGDFLKWIPVLEGDQAFESQGHGGIVVRAYLNSVAAEHANTAEQTYPMPVGSMLAKAVVRNADTPASASSRVYFMRKEACVTRPTKCHMRVRACEEVTPESQRTNDSPTKACVSRLTKRSIIKHQRNL